MQEHVYVNERFISKVNDFGDDYHKDDSEMEHNILLKRVKNIKRRYRDFAEYCEAIDIINDYMDWLIFDKWGGEKRFDFYWQVGLMKDYLPAIPKLKKTRYNYKYMKEGVSGFDKTHFDNTIGKPLPEPDTDRIKIKVKFSKKTEDIFTSKYEASQVREELGVGLEDIRKYYHLKKGKPIKLSKQALKRRIDKEKELDTEEYTATALIKEYYRRLDSKDFDYDDPNQLFEYKRAFIRRSEIEELQVYELLKSCGIGVSKTLSKKSRRLVEPKKKDKKLKKAEKKAKKKEKKMQEKIMESFRTNNYETFDQFTNEIMTVVASDLGRKK